MPTVPIIAPPLAALAAPVADEAYRTANMLVLRNPGAANLLDRCAISIPCHRAGEAPVGLMLVGETGADRRLLTIASAIEQLVAPSLSVASETAADAARPDLSDKPIRM